jgi:hypothetical protein
MRPYQIADAPVPFCGQCAADHRATVEAPSATKKLMTMLFHPLIIPVIGGVWVARMMLTGVQDMSLADPGARLGWSLVAMMVFGAAWSAFLLWQTTSVSRLDPLTEITRSCDFSEDVGYFFEKERRIYAMRNEQFARAFATLNAGRGWTEADQKRSNTLSFRYAVLMLVTLGVVAGIITILSP